MRWALLAACCVLLIGQADAAPLERARGAAPRGASCPPGFAALESSDTCVRISGRVRGETVFGSPRTRGSNAIGTHASGRIQLDIRKQTEYGPLRAVVRGEGFR